MRRELYWLKSLLIYINCFILHQFSHVGLSKVIHTYIIAINMLGYLRTSVSLTKHVCKFRIYGSRPRSPAHQILCVGDPRGKERRGWQGNRWWGGEDYMGGDPFQLLHYRVLHRYYDPFSNCIVIRRSGWWTRTTVEGNGFLLSALNNVCMYKDRSI